MVNQRPNVRMHVARAGDLLGRIFALLLFAGLWVGCGGGGGGGDEATSVGQIAPTAALHEHVLATEVLCAAGGGSCDAADVRYVFGKIVHFTDFHQRIQPTDDGWENGVGIVRTGDAPSGGMAGLKAHIAAQRAALKNVLVVHAGDLFDIAPRPADITETIRGLNEIGLEINALGNHEWDAGFDSMMAYFAEARFPSISANAYRDRVRPFAPYRIVEVEGYRVGFIGTLPSYNGSISGHHRDTRNSFTDDVAEVNAAARELAAAGVRAIVWVAHAGAHVSGRMGGYHQPNGCGNPSHELPPKVAMLDPGVDLVLSGHSHNTYNCRLPNSVGTRIPVVNPGPYGRRTAHVQFALDRTSGEFAAFEVLNVDVAPVR